MNEQTEHSTEDGRTRLVVSTMIWTPQALETDDLSLELAATAWCCHFVTAYTWIVSFLYCWKRPKSRITSLVGSCHPFFKGSAVTHFYTQFKHISYRVPTLIYRLEYRHQFSTLPNSKRTRDGSCPWVRPDSDGRKGVFVAQVVQLVQDR